MYRISSPSSSEAFELYYALRYAVLREPWNQPPGSEKDTEEATSTHAMLTDDSGQCLAVGRLQLNSADEGQIRFMAVHPEHQGKGLGRLVLRYLEDQARHQNAKHILLQARENALNFYFSEGYENLGESFKLWDIIQHYKMQKVL